MITIRSLTASPIPTMHHQDFQCARATSITFRVLAAISVPRITSIQHQQQPLPYSIQLIQPQRLLLLHKKHPLWLYKLLLRMYRSVSSLNAYYLPLNAQTDEISATITAPAYKRDAVAERAIATPASISNWEAASISSACSQVATGTITTAATNTVTIPSTITSSTTQLDLVSTTTIATAIVTVPAVVNCPSGFTRGANVYSGVSYIVSCSATMSGTTFATTNEPNLQNCLSWCNSWGAYCHAVIYDTRYYQNCMLYSAAGTLSSSSTGTVVVRA